MVTEASLETEVAGVVAWLGFWYDRVMSLGRPLVVGLPVLASTMAVLAYALVQLLWRAQVLLPWRRRRREG